jgi:hypothetical protein
LVPYWWRQNQNGHELAPNSRVSLAGLRRHEKFVRLAAQNLADAMDDLEPDPGRAPLHLSQIGRINVGQARQRFLRQTFFAPESAQIGGEDLPGISHAPSQAHVSHCASALKHGNGAVSGHHSTALIREKKWSA